MSKCNFSFEFSQSPETLVAKAQQAITQIGGTFSGGDTTGSFNLPTPLGTVKGSYTISGATIALDITEKPMLIGCGKIEEKLKDYLNA